MREKEKKVNRERKTRTIGAILFGTISALLIAQTLEVQELETSLTMTEESLRLQEATWSKITEDLEMSLKVAEEAYDELYLEYNEALKNIALLETFLDSGITDSLTIEESRRLLEIAELVPYGSPFATGHWITSVTGYRDESLINGDNYTEGIDLIGKAGDYTVRATADGEIIEYGVSDIYGKYIIMEHPGGYRTKYSHLKTIYYQTESGEVTGVKINKGDRIGYMGNTGITYSNKGGNGAHLDYRIYVYRQDKDTWLTLNPTEIIAYTGGKEKA